MTKPTSIKLSEAALWGASAAYAVLLIVERQMGSITTAYFFGMLFFIAIWSVLPYKIGQGRNWARVTWAVLTGLSIAVLFSGETKGLPKAELVFSWAQIPLDIALAYLLFKPESSEWFNNDA